MPSGSFSICRQAAPDLKSFCFPSTPRPPVDPWACTWPRLMEAMWPPRHHMHVHKVLERLLLTCLTAAAQSELGGLLFSLAPPSSNAPLRFILCPTDANFSPPMLSPRMWLLVQLPLNWRMLTSKRLGVKCNISWRCCCFQTALTDSVGNSAAFTQLDAKLAFFYELDLLI